MASYVSATSLLFSLILIYDSPILSSASVLEDLNNLQPPPDFNATISNNCLKNPSLRYCNFISTDLPDIFKSTIVAHYLCNESKNPNCHDDSFTKIDLQNRPKITPLYLSFTFFWKYCPLTILKIDLSNNSIKGNFPSDILQCSQIQALDLSHNQLTGDFPLLSFSPLTNLTLLNLSYNHFSGIRISDSQFFQRFKLSSFLNSGLLPDHQKFKIKVVFFLIGFPIFVFLTVVCFGWICFWRPDFLPSFLRHQHKFTPAMLKAATNGFSECNLVAKIGELDVYRGTMRDGTEIRIEIYRDKIPSEEQRKFVEECRILVQLDHKNLVRVLGWCDHRRLRAIVTEWTDGVNIERWLSQSPPWKQRLKILVGVVEGMCYLEEQWPEVVYDLKTSSVLLSEDQEPLISRFGVGDQNNNSRMVYRFGIFLLEMVANRRSYKEFKRGERSFIEWVRMHYPENMWKVMDERMKKTGITYEQATQGIGLALLCTDLSTDHRQPGLDQISDIVTRVYESSLVSASPSHKRSRRESD
ncbi:Protein kinase domain [Macleaya cordata]|uniref:Protein kinase domain n=1 Tax=Macleaya cordata TaxID=56857 RepID=A0A200Q3U6_MACCD|nr:Protein kinase domain [Macleaya cordata]